MVERTMYTVTEAAVVLCLSKSQVYQMVLDGDLPSVKFGRAVRIPIAALNAWLEKSTVMPTPVTQAEKDKRRRRRAMAPTARFDEDMAELLATLPPEDLY